MPALCPQSPARCHCPTGSGGTSGAALLLEEPEEPRAPCVWLEWSLVVPVRTKGAEWVCDSLLPACLWEPEQTRLWEAVNKL